MARFNRAPKGRSPLLQAAVPEEVKAAVQDACAVVGQHHDGADWSVSGFIREALVHYMNTSPEVAAAYAAAGKSRPDLSAG